MKGYKYTVNKRRANRLAYRFSWIYVSTCRHLAGIYNDPWLRQTPGVNSVVCYICWCLRNLSRSDVLSEAGIFSNLYL